MAADHLAPADRDRFSDQFRWVLERLDNVAGEPGEPGEPGDRATGRNFRFGSGRC